MVQFARVASKMGNRTLFERRVTNAVLKKKRWCDRVFNHLFNQSFTHILHTNEKGTAFFHYWFCRMCMNEKEYLQGAYLTGRIFVRNKYIFLGMRYMQGMRYMEIYMLGMRYTVYSAYGGICRVCCIRVVYGFTGAFDQCSKIPADHLANNIRQSYSNRKCT